MYQALKISPSGLSHKTKKSSFKAIPIDDFRKNILENIKKNLGTPTRGGVTFRALSDVPAANLAKPEECGWTFLINNKDDLVGSQIIDAIKPLAKHRKMDGIDSPLTFNDLSEGSWTGWMDNYTTLRKGDYQMPPQYILIVGSPDIIPLEFQSLLSTEYFVGRLDFNQVNDVKSYAEKIVRIEENDKPLVNHDVTFFATDHDADPQSGCYDPTHYWRYDVENELINDVNGLQQRYKLQKGFKSDQDCIGDNASKNNLLKSVTEKKPCLVYASSWGMFAPGEDPDLQRTFTGALICDSDLENLSSDSLLTADDIHYDTPFLEGGVFFSHSSFSYGAPATSGLVKWVTDSRKWELPQQIAQNDFISALPKKLIFHPRGPLAFIGHFDDVLSYTYKKEESFDEDQRRNALHPISNALENLLIGRPVGHALGDLKKRHRVLTQELARLGVSLAMETKSDRQRERHVENMATLSDVYLNRYESQNYMIFGDPASRI